MSSPELVLHVLRAQLRAAGITYKTLAERIDMSESSVKRMFAQKDMSLSRLAQICKAAGFGMDEILRGASEVKPELDTLSLLQERCLTANPHLLLMAICCLGHWTLEQVVETYTLSEAEGIKLLAELDRLGLIELKPFNRYTLRVSNAFRWQADGPVQQYFRSHVVQDYFGGRFNGPGETLLVVPARLSAASAQEAAQKAQQLAAELGRLHQNDRKLDPHERDGFTLIVGLRSWEFGAFTALRRKR